MKPNKILSSNPKSLVNLQLLEKITEDDTSLGKNFLLGEVVPVRDDKNANRLKIRIPVLDDICYIQENGNPITNIQEGHNKLPWAISAQGRLIETPEPGSIVLVAVFDLESPRLGRVWFCEIPQLDNKKLFEKLDKELKSTTAWQNAESAIGVGYNATPGIRNREPYNYNNNTTNYNVGIRGKGKNFLLFEQNMTTIMQNFNTSNESKIQLSNNINILAAREINILSSQTQQRERPVFADPLFNYLDTLYSHLVSLETALANVPLLQTPISPILTNLQTNIFNSLQVLKQQGKSNWLTIN